MKNKIEQLIFNYESYLNTCREELNNHPTENLEAFIKGKREAYEMIIEDLTNILKNG